MILTTKPTSILPSLIPSPVIATKLNLLVIFLPLQSKYINETRKKMAGKEQVRYAKFLNNQQPAVFLCTTYRSFKDTSLNSIHKPKLFYLVSHPYVEYYFLTLSPSLKIKSIPKKILGDSFWGASILTYSILYWRLFQIYYLKG